MRAVHAGAALIWLRCQALPDARMLQEMERTNIRAAQKTVDPPLLLADDGALEADARTQALPQWSRASGDRRVGDAALPQGAPPHGLRVRCL